MTTLAALAWGTLTLRPYVFVFLATYLALAARDLGAARALGFLGWGWSVAFVAEYASTRIGIPFGLYHYTGVTRGVELYLSNVPFFDSLSFPFLAYAAWCVARWAGGRSLAPGTVGLAAALMMLLDVVIDPVAVRGDRWFLGRVFYYPQGGIYFGVPLSNFAGWFVVGAVIVGGYVLAARGRAPRGTPGPGGLLYYAILLFNLAVTWLIGERWLLGVGILLHLMVFLILWLAVSRGGDAADVGVRSGTARRGSGQR
jgi:putative membrane protein